MMTDFSKEPFSHLETFEKKRERPPIRKTDKVTKIPNVVNKYNL